MADNMIKILFLVGSRIWCVGMLAASGAFDNYF
jgi:hypothetical protein